MRGQQPWKRTADDIPAHTRLMAMSASNQLMIFRQALLTHGFTS